ncbi:MAG: RNA-binding cell elongation regulator Jag/EloR [Bacillota bacterium]
MKAVEKSGKTVEEAVAAALQELGVGREQVKVEVLEEGTRGLLGLIGGRAARVRVTVEESVKDRAVSLLREVVGAMELEADILAQEEGDTLTITLQGKHLGALIGRRGETLNALQYLVNVAANRNSEEKKRIVLDVEGYRKKREETLQRLALRLAEKARRRGRSVVLEPMNPQERRIIHMTLRGQEDIYTFSEGEEPFRKIVIAPRK